ncbi:MAG: GNAT family N-acetyltransferase [Candidatus Thorarchaeota archaeon]
MFEIKIQNNSLVYKKEITNLFTKVKSDELNRELTTEETTKFANSLESVFNSFLTINFLAYESDELVGWLGIGEVYPCTMLMLEFHPIIAPSANKTKIALKLIEKSKRYALEKNVLNIRIFNEVTRKSEKRFLELEQYFLQAGMKKTHVVLCMENKLSADNLRGIAIDNEYHVEPWKEQTDEALTECYTRIFSKSFDNFTNSLDAEERKYWNTISRGKSNDSSIVIKKDDELVALILAVDYGDFMELGPIGVVPEHRGKKLGKILMEECLSRLISQGKIDSYLEVDQTNIPAINLYKSYGFIEVSKKHGFLWRKKS